MYYTIFCNKNIFKNSCYFSYPLHYIIAKVKISAIRINKTVKKYQKSNYQKKKVKKKSLLLQN